MIALSTIIQDPLPLKTMYFIQRLQTVENLRPMEMVQHQFMKALNFWLIHVVLAYQNYHKDLLR